MKKLPIGIQAFSKIREDNYAYVDKTEDIYNLIDRGTYYFLSRPRRFGKSLLIDTISELFQGSKEFFKGLFIYDKWDWSVKYPVIKISFGSGDFSTPESLKDELRDIIDGCCYDVDISFEKSPKLKQLIRETHKKYGHKVVILVDEYDKPIIDVITDKEVAEANRRILGNFYSAIKDSDRYIKFAMLTGVSKFSQMSLFSHLNNLTDITIDKRYGTITGYTQNDLETTFKEHLKGADMEGVKRWYNGYNYFAESIYNPFDILKFIDNAYKFRNYWWESGNPSFLIEIFKQKSYFIPKLERIIVSEEVLSSFDVDYIDLVALLWQTGYLTFDKEIINPVNRGISYKLKVPNLEIQQSLNTLFINYLSDIKEERSTLSQDIAVSFVEGDVERIVSVLKSLFAAIPYNNHTKNVMAHYEGYYASVIFTFLKSVGIEVIPEDTTSYGRIDLTARVNDLVFIFEFKVDSQESPIEQIKFRRYYEKYESEAEGIYLIGLKFDSREKNITDIKLERWK